MLWWSLARLLPAPVRPFPPEDLSVVEQWCLMGPHRSQPRSSQADACFALAPVTRLPLANDTGQRQSPSAPLSPPALARERGLPGDAGHSSPRSPAPGRLSLRRSAPRPLFQCRPSAFTSVLTAAGWGLAQIAIPP